MKTGDVIGRWTLTGQGEEEEKGHKKWLCRCRCGKERRVRVDLLKHQKSQSCGCWAIIHNESSHGVNGSSTEYNSWRAMIARCTNSHHQHYKHYGGRGITVCERWRLSYAAFLLDVGRKPTAHHTLDRIDNNKHYEPSNVRWATPKEQCQNRRSPRKILKKSAS